MKVHFNNTAWQAVDALNGGHRELDDWTDGYEHAINTARAVVLPADEITQELLTALVNLNVALDAFWNVGPDKPTQGTIKAVTKAQQACLAAITKATEAP